jgi:Excalibur calcium-binding domain
MARKLLMVVLLVSIGSYAWKKIAPHEPATASVMKHMTQASGEPVQVAESAPPEFHCDGRTRCSEMTSCDEARYFLRNCPGVKMDGDGDGIPCENQFCGH